MEAGLGTFGHVSLEHIDELEDNLNFAVTMPMQKLSNESLRQYLTETNARLKGRCRGLLEITPPLRNISLEYRVDFLHRTCRDFFMTNEVSVIFAKNHQQDFNADIAVCHALLAELKCIATSPTPKGPIPSELLRAFFHAVETLEKEERELPFRCLNEFDETMKKHVEAIPTTSIAEIYSVFGQRTFMGVIIAQDIRSFAAMRMKLSDGDERVNLLLEAFKTEPFSLPMFTAMIAIGPVINFDFYLQAALAVKLESINRGAIEWVEAVLKYSRFVLEQSLTQPLVSPRLWRVLKTKLSAAELAGLPDSALGKGFDPTLQVQKQVPVRRLSRSRFRRLWEKNA